LRVGIPISHRRQLYPEGAGGSLFNAGRAWKVFDFCAKTRCQELPRTTLAGFGSGFSVSKLLFYI
jgi:hypothetical protein